MEDRQNHFATGPRLPRPHLGADSRSLLRSPAVMALLLSAAVGSAVTTARGDLGTKPAAGHAQPAARAAVAALHFAPAVSAPAERAVKLAAEYRGRGYPVTDELARKIAAAAAANGFSVELAFGLVATESEFKRTAKSPVGAIGLAQVAPWTARILEPGTTVEDLKDPETNLRLGFRFLRDMVERYDGDTATALTAYNRGPTIVDRILKRGGDPDNGYARKVMSGGPRRGPNS